MKYASNNIRNILIAGHAGSGKTTLTEALVYFSGAAERMGRVEDGTTISDFDPEEAKRKASLSASVVPVEYEGIKYNLIDAPGLFDFEAGEYEGIRAAESVLVCVSGRSGVTVGAEKAFQLARKNGKATMVFVSKCDLENANYFKILEDMKISSVPPSAPASSRRSSTTAPPCTSTCSARRPSSMRAASRCRSICPTSATASRALSRL